MSDLKSQLMVKPDEMIFSQIDAAIRRKSGKCYWVNWHLWLVIHIDAPVLEWYELEDGYLNTPRAAEMGPSDQIWVLISDGDHTSRVRVTGGHRFEWARAPVLPVLRWIRRRRIASPASRSPHPATEKIHRAGDRHVLADA
jgi:hypothetical protein